MTAVERQPFPRRQEQRHARAVFRAGKEVLRLVLGHVDGWRGRFKRRLLLGCDIIGKDARWRERRAERVEDLRPVLAAADSSDCAGSGQRDITLRLAVE